MNDATPFYARRTVYRLDADGIIAQAAAQTGLGHHLDAGLNTRVGNIVARVNARGLVTQANAAAAELQMAGILATRLVFAETQARHPQIAREEIRRPVFVIGYARTGTTLMHCLLSCDPAGHAPEAWEAFFPSPPPGAAPRSVAPRVAAADAEVLGMLAQVPALSFHPYFDRLGHTIVEDDEICALDFHNGFPSRFYLSPAAMLDATMSDPHTAYRFHRDVLRQLQWQRNIGHWVVKGTLHQTYLKALLDVYPDAICVYTHRDPNETIASVMATAEIFYRGIEGECDRTALARHTPGGIAAVYNAVLENEMLDDPRVIHIRFGDFMRDQVGTVRIIYEKAGLDFTPTFEKAMRDWLVAPENRSDRYGKFSYTLGDYDIDPAAWEPEFRRYVEHFDLAR